MTYSAKNQVLKQIKDDMSKMNNITTSKEYMKQRMTAKKWLEGVKTT